MKEYLLPDICADLEILMTGGMKPEFYIHKMIFLNLIFDQATGEIFLRIFSNLFCQ